MALMVLPTRDLGFLNQQKLIGGMREIKARLYCGPCCSGKEQKTSYKFPFLPPEGVTSWFLIWCGSRGRVRRVAQVVGPPPWWYCEGFWSFCILLVIICPTCLCTQFLVPYGFLVFCCSRRGVSRCKHCSKGSQVPACLSAGRESRGRVG